MKNAKYIFYISDDIRKRVVIDCYKKRDSKRRWLPETGLKSHERLSAFPSRSHAHRVTSFRYTTVRRGHSQSQQQVIDGGHTGNRQSVYFAVDEGNLLSRIQVFNRGTPERP